MQQKKKKESVPPDELFYITFSNFSKGMFSKAVLCFNFVLFNAWTGIFFYIRLFNYACISMCADSYVYIQVKKAHNYSVLDVSCSVITFCCP